MVYLGQAKCGWRVLYVLPLQVTKHTGFRKYHHLGHRLDVNKRPLSRRSRGIAVTLQGPGYLKHGHRWHEVAHYEALDGDRWAFACDPEILVDHKRIYSPVGEENVEGRNVDQRLNIGEH